MFVPFTCLVFNLFGNNDNLCWRTPAGKKLQYTSSSVFHFVTRLHNSKKFCVFQLFLFVGRWLLLWSGLAECTIVLKLKRNSLFWKGTISWGLWISQRWQIKSAFTTLILLCYFALVGPKILLGNSRSLTWRVCLLWLYIGWNREFLVLTDLWTLRVMSFEALPAKNDSYYDDKEEADENSDSNVPLWGWSYKRK